jgi:hypothetical protein
MLCATVQLVLHPKSPHDGETLPDLAELTRVAAQYGIEILGPKPIP